MLTCGFKALAVGLRLHKREVCQTTIPTILINRPHMAKPSLVRRSSTARASLACLHQESSTQGALSFRSSRRAIVATLTFLVSQVTLITWPAVQPYHLATDSHLNSSHLMPAIPLLLQLEPHRVVHQTSHIRRPPCRACRRST